jgi:hypothetical protein
MQESLLDLKVNRERERERGRERGRETAQRHENRQTETLPIRVKMPTENINKNAEKKKNTTFSQTHFLGLLNVINLKGNKIVSVLKVYFKNH